MAIRVSVPAHNIIALDDKEIYRPSPQFMEWCKLAFGRQFYPVIEVSDGWRAYLDFEDVKEALLFKARWS